MARQWKISLISLSFLFVAVLFLSLRRSPEPTYKGQPIDAWIDNWAVKKKPGYYEAVHEIGTNALPYVVRNLAQNDSRWHGKYSEWQPKLPKFLKKFAPPPKPLLKAPDGGNAIYSIGTNSIPYAIALLKHKSPTVRQAAASGLGTLHRKSPAPRVAIPALIEVLGDPNRDVQWFATDALSEMGSDASNAVPALTRILSYAGTNFPSQYALRAIAAVALGKIGPPAHAAISELKSTLQSPAVSSQSPSFAAAYLRGQVAVAIWRIDGDAETALPVLLQEMTRDPEPMQWDWIVALGEMGPRAKDAVPQLQNELQLWKNDKNFGWVYEHITNALFKIDPAALPQPETKTN